MQNDKSFLGTEPVGKLLWRLALPTVAAQVINMLYNIVDRIYIGHIPEVGAMALTGVGVCMPLIMIVSAFAALISNGGAPRASIFMGRGDMESAERTLGNCFTMQLIVSAVWFAATVAAVIAACCLMAFNVDFIKYFFQGLGELFAELRRLEAYYAINGTAIAVEFAVLCFLSCCAMCLQFYAALAVGHSFANHKMAWSVVFFFGFQFAVQFLGGMGVSVLNALNIFDLLPSWQLSGMAAIHAAMLVLIVGVVIYGAVFYGVTVYFLKRRLNLE